MRRKLVSQKEAFLRSTAGHEERARAAYRGDHLEGLAPVLDELVDSAGVALVVDDPRLSARPPGGKESLNAYKKSEPLLQNTLRQISQE